MKSLSLLVLLWLVASLTAPLIAHAQAEAPLTQVPAPSAGPNAFDSSTAPEQADAIAATFIVNSAADPGNGNCDAAECTLREAIIAANANGSSKDTISFNIPGGNPAIITLASALQAISQPVTIDGLSQPGSTCSGTPQVFKIVINGSGLGAGVTGLKITAGNSEIKGLVIQRFTSHGVEIDGNNNVFSCSFVGTNSAGTLDLGNAGIGVYINGGSNNTIHTNLISGNDSFGVYVSGNGNVIINNRIGTTANGAGALGNGEEGILVQDAGQTRIGSNLTGSNIISGNKGHGILVSGNSPGTRIESNFIGTTPAGVAIPNSGAGIYLNAPSVAVGGTTSGTGNVVAGNLQSGIVIDKAGATLRLNRIGVNPAGGKLANGSYGIYVRSSNNQIGVPGLGNIIGGNTQDGVFLESGEKNSLSGNYIGTDSSQSAALGNGMAGVSVLYAQNTLIGGGANGAANTIAFNNTDGVYIPNAASQGTRINVNSIYSNGDLGIDLGNTGVTPNDVGDGDAGANGLQNFPVLTSAGSNGAATHYAGSLNSKPNQTYRLEFYITGGCDPSGYGEGRGFAGSVDVTTNGSGTAAINAVIPIGISANTRVSATATDANGNTSEFSQCRTAVFEKVASPIFLPLLLK